MYKLTLTGSERKAIDWIGYRYGHGNDLKDILHECDWRSLTGDSEMAEWSGNDIIEFHLPEWAAWQVGFIGDECEHRWDCFAPELAQKMNQFCEGIV